MKRGKWIIYHMLSPSFMSWFCFQLGSFK